jgi:conflict system pore-forming effector with SLATT domain
MVGDGLGNGQDCGMATRDSEDGPDRLVALWCKRARRSESAHYQTAARYSRNHSLLTGATVVLSSVTASGLFASHNSSTTYKVTFGVLGILAAVVAGLDKGQRYAERSEQHRAAGARWAVIVNGTEELMLRATAHRVTDRDFNALRKLMDDTTAHSPQLPQNIFIRNDLEDTYLSAFHPEPRHPVLRRAMRRMLRRPEPPSSVTTSTSDAG